MALIYHVSKLCVFGLGKMSVENFDIYEGPDAVGIVGCADFCQLCGFDKETGCHVKVPDGGFNDWEIV